jgi:PST family polysaccharide transporter
MVGGAAAIAAAVLGAGVWSLVIDALGATVVQSLLALRLGIGRLRGGFHRDAARELWQLSGGQAGFQAMNYWSRNADNLIVGRFVGASALGLYDRAYQLMLLPITQVGSVIGYVLFPAMARIRSDRERLKAAYLRSLAATALLAFPVVVATFAAAPYVVQALFGSKWSGMTPILRLLCLAALPQSIGTTAGPIYQAQGRTDLLLRWGVASGIVTVAAFAIGVVWGVEGVAAAYAIRSYALTYFNFSIPGRLIAMTFRDVLRAIAGPLLLSVLTGLVVWGVGRALPASIPSGARLAAALGVGAGCYLAGAHLARLRAYRDLLSAVPTRRR